MTRISNITIPARLMFRPRRAEWVIGRATVLGWGESLPSLRGSENHIQVRINWENAEQVSRSSRIPDRNDPGPPYHLNVQRDQLPSGVLLSHEKQYQGVDIAGRGFPVIVCVLEHASSLSITAGRENVKDAWEMRSQFLQLEQGIDSLCSFLNRWGHWDNGPDEPIGNLWDSLFNDFRDPINVVVPDLIWSERQRYLRALVGKPHSWLSTVRPINLCPTNKPPYLVVDCWSCRNAIESTITIDHLSHVQFAICKRDDCRKLFKRKTRQTRFYCSPACAHLANVRKLRAQKKTSEAKRKGAEKNGKG